MPLAVQTPSLAPSPLSPNRHRHSRPRLCGRDIEANTFSLVSTRKNDLVAIEFLPKTPRFTGPFQAG